MPLHLILTQIPQKTANYGWTHVKDDLRIDGDFLVYRVVWSLLKSPERCRNPQENFHSPVDYGISPFPEVIGNLQFFKDYFMVDQRYLLYSAVQ